MDDKIKLLIKDRYGFQIQSIVDAPRQFVAETYIIESSNQKYFCKIITKPLFIPHVLDSLPILKGIHQTGFDRLNYPISALNGDLYQYQNNVLIVLFNYIEAPQSFEYDNYALGKLIASLHKITPPIGIFLPEENFSYKYQNEFENQLTQILIVNHEDKIVISLQKLISKYETEMKNDYDNFIKLSQKLKETKQAKVITHGDPGGNILVKSPKDLYLIDWDDILLSAPERDTWFFQDNLKFIKGYQGVFSNYSPNPKLNHFFTYKRYFEDLMEYFTEILGSGSETYRLKNLKALEHDCFEGWLRPAIRQFKYQ